MKFKPGTSFLPNFDNKTTTVGDGLSRIINLITSLHFKLGKRGLYVLVFICATTGVVLFDELCGNEVFISCVLPA